VWTERGDREIGIASQILNGSADVNGISDTALQAALRRQMTMSVARQVAAAGNLANVDTPNYKAVEPTFAETLSEQLTPADIRMREVPGQARRDGNTVQLDRELLAMRNAGGDFSAAQTALAAKFRLIRYAIAESK
jgi:flagellar basal-body rod protein FlgB